jgi:hypothetical protein
MNWKLGTAGVAALLLATALPSADAQPAFAGPRTPQQTETFTGRIVRNPDQWEPIEYDFVLFDQKLQSNFYLDNDEAAVRYEGKDVTVTGTLTSGGDTIHVQSIQPAH